MNTDHRTKTADATHRTPRERWGTCCPYDPECEHSFLDDMELARWLDSPLPDEQAADWEAA